MLTGCGGKICVRQVFVLCPFLSIDKMYNFSPFSELLLKKVGTTMTLVETVKTNMKNVKLVNLIYAVELVSIYLILSLSTEVYFVYLFV